MSDEPVPSIEFLRVHAIDVTHESRQIRAMRVQHDVVVIAHQTIRERSRIEAIQGI